MYAKPHLDQVLFSIGLTFMAVASADYFIGSTQQIVQLPDYLKGRTELFDGALGMGHYRLFIIVVCAALTIGPAVHPVAHPGLAADCGQPSTTSGWPPDWASM